MNGLPKLYPQNNISIIQKIKALNFSIQGFFMPKKIQTLADNANTLVDNLDLAFMMFLCIRIMLSELSYLQSMDKRFMRKML